MTADERQRAAIRAPVGNELHRRDTRVIARAGWHQIITPSGPHGMLNEVLYSSIDDDREVDGVIEQVVAEYRAAGQPTKWCVGPWTRPLNMGEHLARHGFESWNVRAMGCTTDLLADTSLEEIGEVDAANLEAYLAGSHAAWEMTPDQREPEREAHLAAFAANPRTAWFFGARLEPEGEVIGTAAIFGRDRYGYLVGGAVAPAARGRGIYRKLVAARLAFLRARGISYAVTHAREATSAPMLEHLGFETLFPWTCWKKA